MGEGGGRGFEVTVWYVFAFCSGHFSLFCFSLTLSLYLALGPFSVLLSVIEHSALTTGYMCPAYGSVAESVSAPAHGYFSLF